MGNVIPWSQIHPSIKSEEPFIAVVVVDPRRQVCVSEIVEFDEEALADPDFAAPSLVAAAQAAAARVASGYRTRRKHERESAAAIETMPNARGGLRLLQGGKTDR